MKIRNVIQTYSQECGICSVRNLLRCYHLDDSEVLNLINYQSEGNSLEEIKITLKHYFKKVIVCKFYLKEILELKKIQPFILIIHKDKQYHYVVVYKKVKNKFYIYDPAYKNKRVITYEKLMILSTNMGIFVEYPNKQEKIKKEKLKVHLKWFYYLIPIISIVESVFLILSSILLQQLIDNSDFNVYFYFLLQIALMLILLEKTKLFLKVFKHLDNHLIMHSYKAIYKLNPEYLKAHDKEEIIYRLQDAYQVKIIKLSFLFEWISNFVMVLVAIMALLLFSIKFIFLIIAMIPILIFSYFNFKKHGKLLENRRINEYQFFDEFRKDLRYGKLQDEEKNKEKLLLFQQSDYLVEKNTLLKNNMLYCVQSILLTIVVAIYVFKWIDNFSIGKLLASINIISLIIQPLFQLLSEMNQFSNYRLLKARLEDLQLYTKK